MLLPVMVKLVVHWIVHFENAEALTARGMPGLTVSRSGRFPIA
jgi:hypothetical protein